MKIEIVSKDERKLVFILRDSDPVFANTLRRIMKSEVPTMAIEEVNYLQNSSALYDEVLALRLGLIPLKTDLAAYVPPDECQCGGEGCPNCSAFLTLKSKGEAEAKMVYSGDLVPTDPTVAPSTATIPLIPLLNDQELELEAVARLGRGRNHVKWQPGLIGYKYLPTIEVDAKKCDGKVETIIDACPRNILVAKKRLPAFKNEADCSLCKACEEVSEGGVTIKGDPTAFVFTVESFGQLPPESIVLEAARILEKKALEFEDGIKALEE
ncbi:MAG: DNA-directed RNA polymerase subunit D [Candidatus Undinarchaeales archaeon]|jgi:DNA-directed RNA polymerase subunit D|nr:DNA-directed RNA polymerase subunit D [Candidatus Undinarchaeales archaeon]MDP7493447.1 DNA-directed RNA polymerase subunit D [Candidatus Undinarchaeales archaeon]